MQACWICLGKDEKQSPWLVHQKSADSLSHTASTTELSGW